MPGRTVTGVDKSCAIRPPRCATGPRMVTESRRAVFFDRAQVETGAFHINYNMVHCMEGSETVKVHPLMREESLTLDEQQTSSATFSSAEKKTPAPPKGPYAQVITTSSSTPGGRRNSSKKSGSPKKKPPKQPPLGAGGAEGQGNTFTSIASNNATNVTDHEQIPFAVKTQLEVWLAAFRDEAAHHRSKTICYETLLTRVREISIDEEQPTLFSLVTALILLTQFIPLLGPYGDLMQGTIAEIASAVYLLPSKGVGFTVALDAYAKKAFFDAYREVKQLYDMHQARAKRYKSLQRLEANVLQGSVDRWSWQCLNIAFRGWKLVIRFKKRQAERASGYFQRWQLHTFVPRSVRGWARIAKVRLLLAVELDDGEDGQQSQLKQMYAQQQRCKAQRIVAEGENERLTLLEKKNASLLTTLRSRDITVSDYVREAYEGRAQVAHQWAQVMHLMFGDVHDLVAAHVANNTQQDFKAVLEEMFIAATVNANERRRSTATGLQTSENSGSKNEPTASRHPSMIGGGGGSPSAAARRMSVNLSDNAASLKKRATTRSHRLNMQQLVSTILKFAPHLRDAVPRATVAYPTTTTSSGGSQVAPIITSVAPMQSTREESADLIVLLLNRLFKVLGAATPQYPISITDLIQHDQGTLRATIQEVWWALCGGHCSLFLMERCLGPPKALPLPQQQQQQGNNRRHTMTTPPPHASPSSRSISSPGPGGASSTGSSGAAVLSPESSQSYVPQHYHGGHHHHTNTPPLTSLLDKSTTAPMLIFEQRQPFESAVLFPAHRHYHTSGGEGVEAAWMVQDTQRGMDLLQPLQDLSKVSDENWSRIAQQGDARNVHQLAQELMSAFALFHEQRPPPGMIRKTIAAFVRPRDWKRVVAVFPEATHGIHNTMDLVEFVQEVSLITGFAMKSVLTWTLSGLDFSPIERLFVAASSEDVTSAVHMNRDAMKSLMRQCSSMVAVNTAASSVALTESIRSRSSQRGPTSVKKLLVQREKFIACMMSKLSAVTTVTKEQLDDAFTQTLQIRHGTYGTNNSTLQHTASTISGGLKLPPLISAEAPLVAFQNSPSPPPPAPSDEELLHTDEQGFIVLLLFCAHFLDPDPFLPSAMKIGKFLEWVSRQ